jgi:glycosyltransferase involved in cell wall biosynthesis
MAPAADVSVIGFGRRVWPPAAGRQVELLAPPVNNLGLVSACRRLAEATRTSDVLYVVKPRALSYGVSAAVARGRPIILDIDDLEHRFVRHRLGAVRQLLTPDHEPATRILERWRRPVRAVTVASRALQRRYGGTWLPHVRDRSTLAEAAAADGPRFRRALGLAGQTIIGYVGTVRPHKGLDVAARAVAAMRPGTTLLLAGHVDPAEGQRLHGLANGRLTIHEGPRLQDLGRFIGACDVIVVPQKDQPEAHYQSPAKLLDAMAAGMPIVASAVGDVPEILAGTGRLVAPDDHTALAAALAELLDPALRVALGRAARARYEETFMLDQWVPVAAEVLREALEVRGGPPQ